MTRSEQPDFQSLFESVPGLYLALLPDLTIVAASDDYLKATMTKREKILGSNIFDIFPDNPNNPSLSSVSNLRASLMNVLKSRKTDTMPIQQYDIRKPDGSFEVRFWSPVNKPVFDSQKKLTHIIHCVVDVTEVERMKREQEKIVKEWNAEMEQKIVDRTDELAKSEKRFRTLIENNFDAITLNDAKGFPIYQSPSAERMLGWSQEDQKQISIFSLTHHDDLERVRLVFQQVLEHPGKSFHSIHRLQHKNGTYLWTEGLITNMLNDPDIAAIVSNFRDITARKEADERLTKSELLLRSVVHSIPKSLVLVVDRDHRFRMVEGEIMERMGYKRQDYEGKHPLEVLPKEQYDSSKFLYDRVFRGESFSLEQSLPQGDFVIHFVPIVDEDGTVESALIVAIDITDIKRAEENVRSSEEFYRSLISNSSDVIKLVDANGIILFISPSVTRLLGYLPEEMIGRPSSEFIYPEDVERLRQRRLKVIEEGDDNRQREIRVKHKDGNWIWLESNVMNMLDNPVVNGVVVNYRDISERKKMTEQQALLSSIVNSSDDAIISTDLSGNIITWNRGAEMLFGYSTQEMIGKLLSRIVPPQLLEEEPTIMTQIKSGKYVEHYETERMKKDGTIISISLTVSPIKNADGVIIGASKICRDITERKKSISKINALNHTLEKRAAELSESNEELERFAFVASHDLQEPLRMVTSFLQLLQKKYSDKLDGVANQYIHFAVDGSERMKKLIQDLLEYSRVGVNKEDYSRVDLNVLVEEVTQLYGDKIKKSGAKIEISHLPMVEGRKVQLSQLFQNLLSNAIKYRSKEPLKIEIGCDDKKRFWDFYVRDNGIGIDPKFNEKIFIIFQRLHNKSEYEGTGIGLAICRKIVDRHGGRMWVESEPGKGSTFRFLLPK